MASERPTRDLTGPGVPIDAWRLAPVCFGSYAVLVGLSGLVGWVIDTARLTDWYDTGISIQPNTTIAAMLAGAAVILLGVGQTRSALGTGSLAGLLGLATLIQHLSHVSLGIDDLLTFNRSWGAGSMVARGRMGPPAATAFALLGIAFLMSAYPRWRRWAAVPALVTAMIGTLSLVGYLYHSSPLYTHPRLTAIALPTSTVLVALAFGVIAALPGEAPMRLLREESAAGLLVRRALPFVIVVPIVLGLLRMKGQEGGLYDLGMGVALLVVLMIVFMTGLLWLGAGAVRAREREQQRLEVQRQLLVARNEGRLQLLWEAAALLLVAADPQTMLRALFERIGAQLGVDAYLHYMMDETGAALRLGSSGGLTDEQAASVGRVALAESICGLVAQERRPVVATRLQQSADPRDRVVKAWGMRALVCHPLIVDDQVLGTLAFASRSRDVFDADEIDILQIISRYATAAYERLRLINQLRDSDRRKDEFLATLSHELRNPLAPLRNALLLLRRAPHDSAVDPTVSMMERQLGHLVHLVDDLLDVNRISRGKFELRRERVPLGSVVHQAVEALQPICEAKGIALAESIAPGSLDVVGDPTRLVQIVSNLLDNSRKFTRSGGHIAVTVGVEHERATIRVRDDGVGIAADRLPLIFEMFTQGGTSLERTEGGLGIGLTLVKNLVEMHGGEVEAGSAGVGQGAEFVVRLPMAAPLPTSRAPEAATTERPPAERRRVLVVDDNVDSADTLGELLELEGHDVRVVYDGVAAVREAGEFRPDVVLLDVGMPRLNGYDACRQIRAQSWGSDMTLIALTGWGQAEDKRRSQEAGFDAHFVKPMKLAALLELVAGKGGAPSDGATSEVGTRLC